MPVDKWSWAYEDDTHFIFVVHCSLSGQRLIQFLFMEEVIYEYIIYFTQFTKILFAYYALCIKVKETDYIMDCLWEKRTREQYFIFHFIFCHDHRGREVILSNFIIIDNNESFN